MSISSIEGPGFGFGPLMMKNVEYPGDKIKFQGCFKADNTDFTSSSLLPGDKILGVHRMDAIVDSSTCFRSPRCRYPLQKSRYPAEPPPEAMGQDPTASGQAYCSGQSGSGVLQDDFLYR